MELITFGINHHQAPVDIREQVAFAPDTLRQALGDITRVPGIHEALILSTCNRTEIYCAADTPRIAEDAVQWFSRWHGLDPRRLAPFLFQFRRQESVRHAYRVAAGLDSMVLGETQILGQFKQAVSAAREAGALGTLLHKLCQNTFSVAKEVRSSTDIGSQSISMAAAAVRLAERIFPSLSDQKVLFIGAGEMIELCLNHFAAQRPRAILIANRTVERARALGEPFGAAAIDLTALPEHLAQYDIVVASTGSPLPIVGLGMVERAVKARRHKPMFMVDLAVPRDIEPEIARLNDVYLYGVDELSGIVDAGLAARQNAAREAETVIETRVAEFVDWLDRRRVIPTIRAIRAHADAMRRIELERAQKRLAAGDDPQAVIEQMSQALTNKFLHVPTHALSHMTGAERDELAAWLHRLYQNNHSK